MSPRVDLQGEGQGFDPRPRWGFAVWSLRVLLASHQQSENTTQFSAAVATPNRLKVTVVVLSVRPFCSFVFVLFSN